MKLSTPIFLTLAALAVFAAFWTPQPLHSQATPGLEGTYGFTESGTAGMLTMTGVGSMTLHADGSVTGSETFQVGAGSPVESRFEGSYSVQADGSGVVTIVHSLPGEGEEASSQSTARYKLVAVNANAELMAIRIDSGVLVTANFVRK